MDQAPMDIEQLIVDKARGDKAFKQELFNNPKAAIAKELNVELPAELEIEVAQQTPQKLYLVLPLEVALEEEAGEELSEEQLEAVAGGGTPTIVLSLATRVTPSIITRKWPCRR
ncbi:MAG: NHLP leader peptide family natural product precursor [Coleofasciculus sp. C3-bin4]|nr:NHLP leader peptide family natural product precursor [Coleofasciculus sp. C3-bin4]